MKLEWTKQRAAQPTIRWNQSTAAIQALLELELEMGLGLGLGLHIEFLLSMSPGRFLLELQLLAGLCD